MKNKLIKTFLIMTLFLVIEGCSRKKGITRDYEKSPCACNKEEIENFSNA